LSSLIALKRVLIVIGKQDQLTGQQVAVNQRQAADETGKSVVNRPGLNLTFNWLGLNNLDLFLWRVLLAGNTARGRRYSFNKLH
jgi:hypothetical protein